MIRLTSANQARALKGQIPDLMIRRMEQFEGDDGAYDPQRHGYLVYLGENESITTLAEISETGLVPLLDPENPGYEFLEAVVENGETVWELAVAIDNEKTIVVFFTDSPALDQRLAAYLDQLTGRRD